MIGEIIFALGLISMGFFLGKIHSGLKVGRGIRYAKTLPVETAQERVFALGYLECLGHMNGAVPKRTQGRVARG